MMSRFPLKLAGPLSLLSVVGCMYPPMYQQGPYGQQMYTPQGNFAAPGTIYVPPSNTAPYPLGGSTYSTPTTPGTTNPSDDFTKPSNSGDGRYFNSDGEVPQPKDASPGTDTKAPFDGDFNLGQ